MASSATPRWKHPAVDDRPPHTLWEGLQQTAERFPEKTAVVEGPRRRSYRETLANTVRLAQGAAALGLRKGDVAAIYMRNCIEFIEIFYALQKLGVVVAWINPIYREREAAFILRDSGARWVFVCEQWQGRNFIDSLREVAEELPDLETIVAVSATAEPLSSSYHRVLPLDRLFAAEGAGPSPPAAQPDDLSMLTYTSGTTGRPKGAMSTQAQVVQMGRTYRLGVDARAEDVFLGVLPMSHSYGCGAVLVQPLLLGARLVLMDEFSAESALRAIECEQVTLQYGAPAHYLLELKTLAQGHYEIGSLRAGLIAGQVAPSGLIQRVQEEMGVTIASFLGSSETGPSIMFPYGTPMEQREHQIGIPVPGTQARVAATAPGEPGELLLSGWHVMKGYWNNPVETENQLRGGWLHTGDLVVQNDDGCYQILGRLKEWINRGGFKIIPSEIEALVVQHPSVMEACVVGTPNPVLGESICVCLKLHEGAPPLDLEALRAFVRGQVADFKLPDELLVCEEFPRLSGGIKLKRFGAGGVVEIATRATDKQTLRR
jgi:acyl-CoA synthetase (AMP-forming)/AMP-acid ligase II